MSRYTSNPKTVETDGTVVDELDGSIIYSLEGTLDEVIANLKDWKKRYGKQYTRVRTDWVSEEYDEGYKFILIGNRPATDKELAAHNKIKDDETARRLASDLETLERLKAKYEKPA